MERWPSGLRRTPGTRVWVNAHRGFESLLTFSLFSEQVSKLRIYGDFEEGINVFKGVLRNSHDIISLCL